MRTGFWQAAGGLLSESLAHLLAACRDRSAARRDLGTLLAKPHDHLIDDIGLTRHDLLSLTGAWKG